MTDQGDLRERLVGIICDAVKAQEPDGAIIHFSPPARDDRSAIIDGEIDLDAVADALLASGLIPQWQDIESAPKDGTEIWAFNGEQARMKWISGDGYALWVYADDVLNDIDPNPEQPTHFMMLPTPPSAEREG